MLKIAVLAGKGGVTKSAIARALSVRFVERGFNTVGFDMDEVQASLYRWMSRRTKAGLSPTIPVSPQKTANTVKALMDKTDYQVGIIDGAAYASRITLDFAKFVDLVVIPTSYTLDDTGSARRLVKELLENGIPASRICIALSGVEESSVDETETRDDFAPLGVFIAGSYGPRFKSIGKAQDRGLSICEVPFPRLAALAAKMIDSIIDRALEVKK